VLTSLFHLQPLYGPRLLLVAEPTIHRILWQQQHDQDAGDISHEPYDREHNPPAGEDMPTIVLEAEGDQAADNHASTGAQILDPMSGRLLVIPVPYRGNQYQ